LSAQVVPVTLLWLAHPVGEEATVDKDRKSTWRTLIEWGVVPLVVGVLVAVAIVYWGDDAHSVQDRSAPVGSVPPRSVPAEQRMCVPPDPTLSCGAWVKQFKHRKTRQFRAGRLGNAAGYRLPRKWRRSFDRWAAHHSRQAARLAETRDGDWWKWPLEAWGCTPIAGAGYRANCDNAAEHHRQYTKKVVRVTVLCGGLAAVGALAGGGAAGAGRGALACLWGNLALAVLHSFGFEPALAAPFLGAVTSADADEHAVA
jgi:hypothetical protein